ncbi:MAG: serine/threonine-protein kinase, partial [Myxococcota bacterium]
MPDPTTPSLPGPFRAIAPLAQGGFGVVWRGEHRDADGHVTPVAIKLLHARRASALLQQEVRALAAVRHPNIVEVYDTGLTDASEPYLVMEMADQGTLRDHMTAPLPVKPILRALLRALAHAHARGLVHRDIKPANLLRFSTAPTWRLADFGIAYALRHDTANANVYSGTPGYMAPEQWQGSGRDIGPWTDLYSVGCLAWSLLTGLPARARFEIAPPSFPEPVARWLAGLLNPDPRARIGYAVEALWQLDDLPELMSTPRAVSADATVTAMETALETAAL